MELNDLKIKDYRTVRDAVFDKLKEAILTGYLQPGERLVEADIAEKMDVSRTPVREAIRRLEMEKLVIYVPRKGVVVSDVSEEEILQLYTIRAELEGLAVRWAVNNVTDEDITNLKDYSQKMEESVINNDLKSEVYYNSMFHDYIVSMSHSQILSDMLKTIHENIQRFRFKSLSLQGRPKSALLEHELILNAIKEKNAEEASFQIIKHIENASVSVLKQLHSK